MLTEVYCTLQVEGTHHWPDCPFDEVAYLRDPHRHIFHIKAYKQVNHDDRDVEFIMLQHRIRDYLDYKYSVTLKTKDELPGKTFKPDFAHYCVFGAMSCEMIARELMFEFDLCRCEVSEDNENGAIVTDYEHY